MYDPGSNDPDDPGLIIYRPGMCSILEPYSYWWFFWGCNEAGAQGAAEDDTFGAVCEPSEVVTMTHAPGGGILTTINRNGRITQRVTFPKWRTR